MAPVIAQFAEIRRIADRGTKGSTNDVTLWIKRPAPRF